MKPKESNPLKLKGYHGVVLFCDRGVELDKVMKNTLDGVNITLYSARRMFNDAKRPFYASTIPINLGPIDENKYADFIRGHFKKAKREITTEVLDFILKWTFRHTFIVQALAHKVFQSNCQKAGIQEVKEACDNLMLD